MTTNRLKTIIIDDEARAVNLLTGMLSAIPAVEVTGTFTYPVHALTELRHHNPDLLLLDIQMPRLNGFELLRGVRNAGLSPWVIFVTAYDQYAVEAIRQEAFDYLLKPVSPDELESSIFRLLSRHKSGAEKPVIENLLKNLTISKLRFSDRNGTSFFAPSDMVYIMAEGNYSTIQLKDRRHIVTRKIGELEEMLLPHGFIRISRSYLINPVYLCRIDRKRHLCLLECGEARFEIPVPETRTKEV